MQLADYYLRQLQAHDIENSLAYSEDDIKQMAESIAKIFSAKMFSSPVLSIRNLHQAVNIPVSRIRKMMAVVGLVERPDKKEMRTTPLFFWIFFEISHYFLFTLSSNFMICRSLTMR